MLLRFPPDWALSSPIKWVAVALGGEVLWLGLLYPLVPKSPFAWLITLLLPAPIGLYGYYAARGIISLAPQPPAPLWRQLLAGLLAISVGVLTFLLIAFAERQLDGQFQYGVLRSH